MFKNIRSVFLSVLVLSVVFSVSVLNISCRTENSDEINEEIFTGFNVLAYGRNESIFLTWTGLSTETTILDFEKVSIKVEPEKTEDETSNETEKLIEIPDSVGRKQYLISNLENDKTYKVKFAGFIGNQSYSKEINVLPRKISYNFELATAIVSNGKIFISFTFDELEDSEENLKSFPDIKEFNLYKDIDGQKVFDYKRGISCAHEKIEIKEDSTKPYKKYYFMVVDDEDLAYEGNRFELRVLNSENIEAEPLKIETKKAELPVVNISIPDFLGEDGKLENFKAKEKINASLEVFNCSETMKPAALTIKGRGNSSWSNAQKKSYTIKFKDKQNFLGLGKNKSFALIANYFDKTLLRNLTSYELAKMVFTKMPWNPGAKCVNLFINNVYQGVYLAVESIKIGEKRVDIPDIAECKNIEEIDNYGFILEVDSRQDENFNFRTEKNVPFSLKEPDGDDLQNDVRIKIQKKVQAAENALYSQDFKNPDSENYYGNFLDVDSFVDWWLLEELAKNTDSNFYSSCYIYFNPADKKFGMGPVWDFDLGWGNINTYNPENSYTGFKAEEKPEKDGKTWKSWILRLLQDENFKEKAKSRWNEMKPKIEEYFDAGNTDGYEANFESLNHDAELNFARWPILGKATWKCPLGYEERKTFAAEKEFFIDWKNNRIQWLDENI